MDEVDYGHPESFFVFIVGHCKEWPENRVEQGDIALYNEYLAAGVPPDQICHVKDGKCTNTNCQKQLIKFLEGTWPRTTLVFYYGGHGSPEGFNTRKAMWKYREVTSAIENFFQGERVLYLPDCCASGNLTRWLSPPYTVTKQYIVLATTPPFIEASDDADDEEWVLNNCWLAGMRCSDGKLPLSRVIDRISDRIAFALGDQFTPYATAGADYNRCDWMPRRQPDDIKGPFEWDRLDEHVPEDAIVSSRWSVGSCVFYKHRGGPYKPGADYIPPCWLDATILSEPDDESVELEVSYPGKGLKWNVEAKRKELMNNFYMGQMYMIPEQFEKAQCVLARNFKYLDFSLEPNTMIKAADSDGEIHSARVLDWRYFDWDDFVEFDDCNQEPPFGAHVPVQWLHDDETDLIPVQAISSPNVANGPFLDSLESVKGKEDLYARKALFWSIESSGKTVCNASDEIGSKLTAFWPEDEELYDAKPLDPNKVPLKVLATHAQFPLTGKYCPLAYEDGDKQLSPLFYVEKRRKKSCCSKAKR